MTGTRGLRSRWIHDNPPPPQTPPPPRYAMTTYIDKTLSDLSLKGITGQSNQRRNEARTYLYPSHLIVLEHELSISLWECHSRRQHRISAKRERIQ